MQSFKKYISDSPELEEGLWANIAAKRARGERPAKPGEKGYPKTLDVDESAKGYQPGWMLKKDPELAKKIKDKTDLAKRRQASYGNPAAGKSVKEETELQELSKETLKSYSKKAGAEATGVKGKHLSPEKSNKRFDGFAKAASRLAKEDVEQIDELSKETLGSYKHKAELSIPKDDREYANRSKGIDKAEKKLKKESVEQLDELSPNLLHRYVKKATGNMGMHAVDHGKYGDQQKDKKSLNKAIKRSSGIASASGRMADKANRNEEVELDESEINNITAQYINENNITLEELENMTEAELNELIGKAVGGAFKLGAKAAVGATRLAGKLAKKAVINKQGNFRFGAQGKADAEKSALDKEKAKDKAIRDRERFAKERQALRDRQNKEKQSKN